MIEKNLGAAQSNWKMAVATLWILQAVNFIAYLLIVYLPGDFDSYSGLDAETPMGIAVFCAVPGLLICLTLSLAPRVSRWPNLLFGAGYTLIKIGVSVLVLIGGIAGPNGEFLGGLFVNEVWGIFAGALLVWCAWRVPDLEMKKIDASEVSARAA